MEAVGENMKEYPEWRAIIFEEDMTENTAFAQCISRLEGIIPVVFPKYRDGGSIREKLNEEGILPGECLMIVAEDEALDMAKNLGIAVLAYLCSGRKHQKFTGESMLVEGFDEIDKNFLLRQYQRFHGIPWTIAVTKRCRVRELVLEDLPALYELYEKPHITDYVEPLFPWEEELEYQKAYIANMYHYYGFGMWLVFEKDTDRLIGRAGLEMREYEEGPGLELGYIIAPEYQRQGYAAEVCGEILRYAAEELEISEVNCLIEPDNTGSILFAEKLGFCYADKIYTGGKEFLRLIKRTVSQ